MKNPQFYKLKDFKGDYKNGKKDGKGIYKYLDGSFYEGNFEDNLIEIGE